MTAQNSEISHFSIAVLLCLGKYHQLSALEYWLAHHLAFDIVPFIAFSNEVKEAEECREILKILGRRYQIKILEIDSNSENIEAVFYQKTKEKQFSFALRLALDEFFVPNLSDIKAQLLEDNGLPALKIPYRHCGLLGHDPKKILKFGLNPRNYYTKMTDGAFAPDAEGRFFCSLQENPESFPIEFQKALILHDAASSSLSEPARKFFDQGDIDIPAAASPFKVEKIIATMWQDILAHYLTQSKTLPQWLLFPPTLFSWHFLKTNNDEVLAIDHQTRKIHSVPNREGTTYSRLILGKKESNSGTAEGYLCLFDPAPFPFLPLKEINARTPALPVEIKRKQHTYQIQDSFTQRNIMLDSQQDFTLLQISKNDLPYPLAALDRLLLKGKETAHQKHLLDGFPAPPVTALWALMTRPEFFKGNESFSLFSLLKALLSNEKYFPLPPK